MCPPPPDAGGRVGLQPLDSWDRRFEPRGGHGYSSLVFVVCCTGSDLCDGPITHTEEFLPDVCDMLQTVCVVCVWCVCGVWCVWCVCGVVCVCVCVGCVVCVWCVCGVCGMCSVCVWCLCGVCVVYYKLY
jgi:hypothetical protein